MAMMLWCGGARRFDPDFAARDGLSGGYSDTSFKVSVGIRMKRVERDHVRRAVAVFDEDLAGFPFGNRNEGYKVTFAHFVTGVEPNFGQFSAVADNHVFELHFGHVIPLFI